MYVRVKFWLIFVICVASHIHYHSQGTEPQEFLLLLFCSHTLLPTLFLIPAGLISVTALAYIRNTNVLQKTEYILYVESFY